MAEETIKFDKAAFPGKAKAIKQASVNLRGFIDDLEAVVTEVRREAKSFTTGDTAPVFAPVVKAIEEWHTAVKAATGSVCDSADNCVETMTSKFKTMTGIDADTSGVIRKL